MKYRFLNKCLVVNGNVIQILVTRIYMYTGCVYFSSKMIAAVL